MRTILTSFFFLLAIAATAQPLEDAMKAFGQGEADRIANWIDRDVEIAILGSPDYCSKSQATTQLKNFFTKYPPKSVSEIHRGSSKNEDSRFIIAHLMTANGKFRLYLYGVEKASKFALEEIRIERE
jgi:hypothetical protein